MKKILIIVPFILFGCSNLRYYEYYGKYYGVAAEFNIIKRMIEEDVANGTIHPIVANDYIKAIDSINIKIKNLAQYGKKPLGIK